MFCCILSVVLSFCILKILHAYVADLFLFQPFCRIAVQYCGRYSELAEMEESVDSVAKKAGKIIFEVIV